MTEPLYLAEYTMHEGVIRGLRVVSSDAPFYEVRLAPEDLNVFHTIDHHSREVWRFRRLWPARVSLCELKLAPCLREIDDLGLPNGRKLHSRLHSRLEDVLYHEKRGGLFLLVRAVLERPDWESFKFCDHCMGKVPFFNYVKPVPVHRSRLVASQLAMKVELLKMKVSALRLTLAVVRMSRASGRALKALRKLLPVHRRRYRWEPHHTITMPMAQVPAKDPKGGRDDDNQN